MKATALFVGANVSCVVGNEFAFDTLVMIYENAHLFVPCSFVDNLVCKTG